MTTETRIDQPHDIQYPRTADARGSARVYHMRTTYYMGPHESPLSHVIFGLWKQKLIETGTAPTTREIRAHAERLMSAELAARRSKVPAIFMAFFFASACLASGFIGGQFFSTPQLPMVDGIPLSANETGFIRGRRMERLHFDSEVEAASLAHDAELTAAISEGRLDRHAILERIRGL